MHNGSLHQVPSITTYFKTCNNLLSCPVTSIKERHKWRDKRWAILFTKPPHFYKMQWIYNHEKLLLLLLYYKNNAQAYSEDHITKCIYICHLLLRKNSSWAGTAEKHHIFPAPTSGLSENKRNYLKKLFWGHKTDYTAFGSQWWKLGTILNRLWLTGTRKEL